MADPLKGLPPGAYSMEWTPTLNKPWVVRYPDGRALRRFDDAAVAHAFLAKVQQRVNAGAKEAKALLGAAERLAALTDGVTSQFERELAVVYVNLERQLRELVAEAADLTRTQVIRATRVLDLRKKIRQVLTDAGFDGLLLAATDAPLDALAEASLMTALGQDVQTMLSTLEPRIAALKALTLTDLLEQPEAVAFKLWQGVTQGVFSARTPKDILADLYQALDDTVPHIETLYDTSVSIYSRQVASLLSDPEDQNALFLYSGPVDALVRPFCAERVGKVYSRAEIDAMDNDQLPNTFLTAGGYNCRHSWAPLSRFSDLRDLHETGQRAPEVDEAIAAGAMRFGTRKAA